MAGRSGNGWVTCAQEHQHWGQFGAAGLLAYVPGPASPEGSLVLLQHRARWSHRGGTWALPGGAMDSEETPAEAALREADEECGVNPHSLVQRGLFSDEHGGWTYHTVLAEAREAFKVCADAYESDDAAWVPAGQVAELDLHPGFAACWPLLCRALLPLTVVVDAAALLRSRPAAERQDWDEEAGRLRAGLAELARTGLTALPAGLDLPRLVRWYPDFVLVVAGADGQPAADGASAPPPGPKRQLPGWLTPAVLPTAGVRMAGTADPGGTVAGLAGALPGRRLVVTAGRERSGQATAAGAAVTGPDWLLALL